MQKTITAGAKKSNRGNLVNTKHVESLISNYKKNRWKDNSNKIGKPDSLSAWYGLDEMLSFIELAKKNKADGIKLYFGEYPEDYQQNPDFQKRQTVVLVATRKSKNENGVTNKDLYFTKDNKWEILAFNEATLCPPWCIEDIPPFLDEFHGNARSSLAD